MASVLTALQGSLGALLAIELAVVAALSVVLVWLFARRGQVGEGDGRRNEPGAPAATTAIEWDRLRERLAAAEAETERLRALGTENELLRQRLGQLEGDLHDYELVRDEIAQVGTLKLENQRLKEAIGLLPISPDEPVLQEPTRIRDA